MTTKLFVPVLVTAFVAVPVFAATPAIGLATAVGAFSLNNASVTGDIEIAEGTQLRTTTAPSDVHLKTGVEVRLATRSAGTVYGDHLVLREGAVRLSNFDTYPVAVSDLQIQTDDPAAQAVVRLTPKTIEVASIGGTVKVSDGGAMLTRVAAGTKMSFANDTNNAGQATTPPPGQTGAVPAQTGAAPAPAEKGPVPDKKAILWSAGVCAVGAIVVGSLAAAEGKSPF